jgi:thiol-disulfide isomerase/thioredoxin
MGPLALAALTVSLATATVTAPAAGPPPAAAPTPAAAGAGGARPTVAIADVAAILDAVKAPGARAVLVNVWASWCEPCREEMPELLRFYRDHRARGLRLVLISADDEQERGTVERLLAAAAFDGPAFIKHGNDMAFIDALDRRWSGELPSTFVFDGRGAKRRFWPGTITYRELERSVSGLLAPDTGKTAASTTATNKKSRRPKP